MKYCGLVKIEKGFSLSELKKINWEVGEMRKVNFFKGVISPVYLTSVDHENFIEHLNLIDTDETICLDLEWRISFSSGVKHHVSLFQFCTKNATLIVRHLSPKPNQILKQFLMTHDFIGKSTGNDKSRMKDLFGDDFSINLEDIVTTRLSPNGFSRNFNEMVKTFVGPPLFAIKDKSVTMSNWEREHLALAQVLYAAYDVVSLQLALPNLPPPINPSLPQVTKPKPVKQRKTQTNSEKSSKSNMKESESAKLLYDITFPLRDPIPPDFILDKSQKMSLDEACKTILVLFGKDPDEIPCTLELKGEEEDFDDDEIRSEYIPEEAFDENSQTPKEQEKNDNKSYMEPKREKPIQEITVHKYLYLESSSYSDYSENSV